MTWNTDDMRQDFTRLYDAKKSNADAGLPGEDMSMAYEQIGDDGADTLTGQSVESSWLKSTPWANDGDAGFTGERINVAQAEIKNLPPEHPAINALGELMQSIKDIGDKYEVKDWVPLLGGMGVGELLMGKGPEWVKDAAHGFGMQTVPIAGGVRIPDKRALDAGFSAVDAAGVAKGTTVVGKKAAGKAIEHLVTGVAIP